MASNRAFLWCSTRLQADKVTLSIASKWHVYYRQQWTARYITWARANWPPGQRFHSWRWSFVHLQIALRCMCLGCRPMSTAVMSCWPHQSTSTPNWQMRKRKIETCEIEWSQHNKKLCVVHIGTKHTFISRAPCALDNGEHNNLCACVCVVRAILFLCGFFFHSLHRCTQQVFRVYILIQSGLISRRLCLCPHPSRSVRL